VLTFELESYSLRSIELNFEALKNDKKQTDEKQTDETSMTDNLSNTQGNDYFSALLKLKLQSHE